MAEQTTPALRYRSAREIAADPAVDAEATLDRALSLLDGQSEERDTDKHMLVGLCQRTDLSPTTLARICEELERDKLASWQARLALLTNPAANVAQSVRDLVLPTMIPLLLPHGALFAEEIVRTLHRHPVLRDKKEGWSGPLVSAVRETLGEDLINEVLTRWITTGGERGFEQAAATPLLTPHGWALMFDRARTPGVDLYYTFATLARRPDITVDYAKEILDITDGHDHETSVYQGLLSNKACPVEVFTRLVKHRKRSIADLPLAHDTCPDEVRWIAARRHRPYAVLKASTSIPSDVAHAVLDDLDALISNAKPLPVKEAADIRSRVAALTDDAGVLVRLLTRCIAEATTPAVGVGAFFVVAQDIMRRDLSLGENREDMLLRLLAESPIAEARAFVVPRLLSGEDVAIAARDSEPLVRVEAAGHPLLPTPLLSALMGDPDERVRTRASERFLTALAGTARAD